MTTSSTVDWSISGYYFISISSIAVGCLFTYAFIKIMVTPMHRNCIMINKYSLFLLIIIILTSFYKPFIMWGFIFNFNDCTQITKRIDQLMLAVSVILRLFMILKIVEINFQKFPLLAYSKVFILGLKIFMILLFITTAIVKFRFFPVQFNSYELASNKSIHVCIQSSDHATRTNDRIVAGSFIAILFVLHIYFGVLFIRKAIQLYNDIKDRIDTTHQKNVMRGLTNLCRVMKPIFRHSILVSTIILSLFCFVILRRLTAPEAVPLNVLDDLIVGGCIVSMFPFGTRIFDIFCGCLQRYLVGHWLDIEMHLIKLNTNNATIPENMNADDHDTRDLESFEETINGITDAELTSVMQESYKSSVKEMPSFNDWKSIEESMECDRLQMIVPP